MNYILFTAIFAVAIGVWQARWPQAAFDWIAIGANAYLMWSLFGKLENRIDLLAVALLISACVARSELHRNGVAMPRMWWRD
jgi:hypothetical protein